MLIVVRPEPGCAATLAAARELGFAAEGHPLFAVRALGWAPPPAQFDALLIGSANAVRHAGPGLAAYAALPVYAVGAATAAAAREAGLTVIGEGAGGLQSLLGALDPAHSPAAAAGRARAGGACSAAGCHADRTRGLCERAPGPAR